MVVIRVGGLTSILPCDAEPTAVEKTQNLRQPWRALFGAGFVLAT